VLEKLLEARYARQARPRLLGEVSFELEKARYLGHYVRDLGLLPIEEAIGRITSVPARRYGLADRGVIAEGMAADIVVFDPATITDRATYDQPRLLAEGVHHVLVNGELVLCDGQLAGARSGSPS
jgi:N-acyl-D-amino-acid deacylase